MKSAQCPLLQSIVSSNFSNSPILQNPPRLLPAALPPSLPAFPTTWAIAGITLSLTSVAIVQALQPPQTYEGTVRFAISSQAQAVPPDPGDWETAGTNVFGPVDGQIPVQPWQYADFLGLARQHLQAQGSGLSDRDLLQNLQIQIHPEAGTLEVHYQGTQADQVYQVLEHLAQSYAAVGSDCSLQSCRTLRFVEWQMMATEQRLQQLEAEVTHFQQQYGFQQPEAQREAIAQSIQALRQQQQELARQLESARHDLQAKNEAMGFAADDSIANLVLQEFLDYGAALEQWQRLDLEIMKLNLQQPPQTARMSALQRQHQRLSSQLRQEITQAAQVPIPMMPTPIFAAVDAQPARADHLESFLVSAHQVNLLLQRQAVLNRLEQMTAGQMQQWQALAERQAKLQSRVNDTQAALALYQSQIATLQHYQDLRANWQIVSAPELVERPPRLAWSNWLPASGNGMLSSLLILGSTISIGAIALSYVPKALPSKIREGGL
ncbi:MAG: hypothetical protein VKK04_02610 [Synechococcales bacterium]|nr:hypothetical protein [Synechococcales bacterium]